MRWFFSLHALKRMDEMAVPRQQVLACLAEPEITWFSESRGKTHQRGDITVATRDDRVVTVLWRTQERYLRRADPPAGDPLDPYYQPVRLVTTPLFDQDRGEALT